MIPDDARSPGVGQRLQQRQLMRGHGGGGAGRAHVAAGGHEEPAVEGGQRPSDPGARRVDRIGVRIPEDEDRNRRPGQLRQPAAVRLQKSRDLSQCIGVQPVPAETAEPYADFVQRPDIARVAARATEPDADLVQRRDIARVPAGPAEQDGPLVERPENSAVPAVSSGLPANLVQRVDGSKGHGDVSPGCGAPGRRRDAGAATGEGDRHPPAAARPVRAVADPTPVDRRTTCPRSARTGADVILVSERCCAGRLAAARCPRLSLGSGREQGQSRARGLWPSTGRPLGRPGRNRETGTGATAAASP